MKPAAFDYLRADNPQEVVQHLAQFGDEARILAGGQSLMPILNMRLAQPQVLVDISRSQEMAELVALNTALEIGAAVTQGAVQARPGLIDEVPLLAMALPWPPFLTYVFKLHVRSMIFFPTHTTTTNAASTGQDYGARRTRTPDVHAPVS